MRNLIRSLFCLAALLLAVPAIASADDRAGKQRHKSVDVQLLGLNDFHGALKPPTGSGGLISGFDVPGGPIPAGGAAFIGARVREFEAQNPNTMVVSAGDLIGASPLLSALFQDEPTIEAMNEIGLDLNAVGNHEFDEGTNELLRMQYGGCHPTGCKDGDGFDGADFDFLAANVVTKRSGRPLFAPYAIKKFDGVKVGFIGMTLEGTPGIVVPSGVANYNFLDEAQTANKYARILREEHGVKAIVVLLHEGGVQTGTNVGINTCSGISGPIVDIVNKTSRAVDLFVTGHTHAAYNCKIDGRAVTSASSNGRLITDLDLKLDRRTRDVREVKANNTIVTRTGTPLAGVQSLIEKYDTLAKPFAEAVIGYISTSIDKVKDASGENAAGNLIADSQLAKTDDEQGAVAAFMNPGGVRDPGFVFDSPAGTGGELTYEEIFTVQPFGNNLTTITLTGAQLITMLNQQWCGRGTSASTFAVLLPSSTVKYTWDESLAAAARAVPCSGTFESPLVGDVLIGGAPVTAGGSYRITVNSFLADGGDGFTVLREGTNRVGGVVDLDALSEYLDATTPAAPQAPPALDRIDVVP